MRINKLLLSIIGIVSLLVAGSILLLYIANFRAFIISSPSMGETAPVGSLVVVQKKDTYKKSDIISFYREDTNRIYSHRIIEVRQDGRYTTKGDLNAVSDALPVKAQSIIGSSVFINSYLGWVLRGLPWVLFGWCVVYLISSPRRIRFSFRWPIRLVGGSLVVALVAFFLNPWLHVDLLSYQPNGSSVDMHIINTGVFPIKHGDGRLMPGQDAIVTVANTDSNGRFMYVPRPSLGMVGAFAAALFCLLPLLLALFVRIPPPMTIQAETDELETDTKYGTHIAIMCVIALLSITVVVLQAMSLAAFVASVRNATDTAKTRTYFTCANAMSATAVPRPYLAYRPSSTTATENDISGNGRTATNVGIPTYTTSTYGCRRDTKQAAIYNGTSTCTVAKTSVNNPNTYSLEAWFQTGVKSNGKIIGFGSSPDTPANDSSYDRQVYIDPDGRIVYSVYSNYTTEVRASIAGKNYADNAWHHLVATLSSGGMKLYLDGVLVSSSATVTTAENYTGYWKVGCGRIQGEQTATGAYYDGPSYFNGNLQFAAVYTTELTANQVKEHYDAGQTGN